MRGKRTKQIRQFADTFPGETQPMSRKFKKIWTDASPAERKHMAKQMRDVKRLRAKAEKESSDAANQ